MVQLHSPADLPSYKGLPQLHIIRQLTILENFHDFLIR